MLVVNLPCQNPGRLDEEECVMAEAVRIVCCLFLHSS